MAYTDLPVGSTISGGVITIPVGDVAIGVGNLRLRVKALGGNNAGDVLTNAVAFTVAGGGGISTDALHYHNFDSANITTDTNGSDTVVIRSNNLNSAEPDLYMEQAAATAPTLVPNAFGTKSGIQMSEGKTMFSHTVRSMIHPLTIAMVVQLPAANTGFKYLHQTTSTGMGFFGNNLAIVADNNTILQATTPMPAAGTPFIFIAEFNASAVSRIYQNNTMVAEGDAGSTSVNWGISLGYPGLTANVIIGEIRTFEFALTQTEREDVVAELAALYGITV